MPGLPTRPTRTAATRAIASLAVAGAAAATAMAAAPTAVAAHAPAHQRATHMSVHGLVAERHGRRVTVFAETAKIGRFTTHNQRVHLRFAPAVHRSSRIRVGDHIRVQAIGRASGDTFTVMRHNDETVTPAPASLFFGSVVSVDGSQFVVAEHDRDNGDQDFGDDHGHGRDGNDWGDDVRSPDDQGPGGGQGPGDGGGTSGPGHRIVVDDSNASVTVDGSTDTALAAGDTVAILGEATDNTIVAADVFGYTTAPDFLRGDITAIDGDTIMVGDDNDGGGHGGDDARMPFDHGQGGDDNPVTVHLASVPLAVNGALNSSVGDLAVGEKLIVLGTFNSATNAFDADAAFAFNGHDDQPCPADNDQDDNHRGDHGPGDGGLDG